MPVKDFADGLPKEDQAKFWAIYQSVKTDGLHCPNVEFKRLKEKLWEIKFSAPRGGYRVAYVMFTKDQMVWLHAFKKTSQKTPRPDLELAFKRMKEVLDYEKG